MGRGGGHANKNISIAQVGDILRQLGAGKGGRDTKS